MIVSSGSAYLAVIPARGGSKRIPRKNLRACAGMPLLAWSVEHAAEAEAAMRLVVSTEDEEIAELACKLGAEVPALRPHALATDEAPTEPVLLHALDTLPGNEEIRHVVLLAPTSPVRAPGALDGAVELYERTGADSLVSVSPANPLLWRGTPEAPVPLWDLSARPRRQCVRGELQRYSENGSIVISRASGLRATGNRLFGRIVMYVMSEREGVDVDTPFDFWLAERILEVHDAR